MTTSKDRAARRDRRCRPGARCNAQTGAVEAGARERQHVAREIDAEAALDIAGEELKHPPSAGAEIEQRAHRPVAERRADRASTAASATWSWRMRSHCGSMRAGNNSARRRRVRRGPPPAARDRGRRPDPFGSSRAISARAMSAALPRSPGGRTPTTPSRKRSTSPASAKSRRWREMRGCDWRTIAVRSETVSSASAMSDEQSADASPRPRPLRSR